jgi:RNA polymerase primary sigma factor
MVSQSDPVLRGPTSQPNRKAAAGAVPDQLPRPGESRLLTQAEEVLLAKRIERGDVAAKETMVACNLGLVRTIARTFRGTSVPSADLVQEGTVGLVRAVERFDYRRGVRFSTYAAWWIRRAMLDAIGNAQVIRIPPKAGQQLAAVRRAEAELVRVRPGPHSDVRISERTGLSTATVRSLRTAARVTASLEEPVGEDNTVLGELVADQDAVDPGQRLIEHEERTDVVAMLRLLPERHREVVARRFGLDHKPEQTHAQISAWLGVGEERTRQLEREALHRLRTIAQAWDMAA